MEDRTKIWTFKDHYAMLEIAPTATEEEIKKAFWRKSPALRKKAEWDKQAQKEFIAVVDAYRTLSEIGTKRIYDKLCALTPEEREEVLRVARGNDYTQGVIKEARVKQNGEELDKTLELLAEAQLYAGNDTPTSIEEKIKASEQDRKEREGIEIPAEVRALLDQVDTTYEKYWTAIRGIVESRDALEADARTLQERIKNPERKDRNTVLEYALKYHTKIDNENKRTKHLLTGMGIVIAGVVVGGSALGYQILGGGHYPKLLEDYCARESTSAQQMCELGTTLNTGSAIIAIGLLYIVATTGYYKQKTKRQTGEYY